jgi:hypothetical protein
VLTNREGYHLRNWNVDFTATKRLANRWMVRGSVTLQNNQEFFDDPSTALQDPTPRAVTTESALFLPASPAFNGGVSVNSIGGGAGARGDVFMQAKWSYNAMALYQLPWGVSVSGTVYGHQGYPRLEYVSVNRGSLGTSTQVLLDPEVNASRYDSLSLVDLRVQKAFTLGRVSATFDFDLFNLLNESVVLQANRQADSSSFQQAREIVAPRVARVGLRIMF